MNIAASLLIAALLATSPAVAQTWTGAGADNNWSTAANWSGGVAPASSPATQLSFPSAAARKSPVVDVPWTVNRMTFATSYTPSGQAVTLDGVAAGIDVTGGSVVMTTPVVLAAPATFNNTGNLLTINAVISGPGSLAVGGSGTTILAGTETFTGGFTVTGGVLGLAGTLPGPVVVTGGTFSGSGFVNGPLTLTGATATLAMGAPLTTGNLTAAAGSSVTVSIAGTEPGSYGSTSVNGTVNLGAQLTLNGSYVPVPGDVFTIIANDGTDPIAGTFAGLPEGSSIAFNGVALRISYVGGTGNDITLSVPAAALATPVPTLSEWALIVLALAMAGMGVSRLRSR